MCKLSDEESAGSPSQGLRNVVNAVKGCGGRMGGKEEVQELKWECGHASVPGHQLCEGRKRREKRRRRRKSGEGGREQHHASRSNIGGARADAAGEKKNNKKKKKKKKNKGGNYQFWLFLLFSKENTSLNISLSPDVLIGKS